MGIEGLHITVFPRTARLNKERFDLHLFEPLLHFLGRKFRPVVAADVIRQAAD